MLYRPKNFKPHLTDEQWEQERQAIQDAELEQFVASLLDELSEPASATEETSPKTLNPEPLKPSHSSGGESITPDETGNYQFPVRHTEGIILRDHDAVMLELRGMVSKAANTNDYPLIRKRCCELHLLLCDMGLWAPGFRPWPKLEGRFRESSYDFSVPENQMHRDRLIVDLYWFHSRREQINVKSSHSEWAPLFDFDSPFNFELAEKFALESLSNHYRVVEILALTAFQQLQAATLRSKTLKQHAEAYIKSSRGLCKEVIPSPDAQHRAAVAHWREMQPRVKNPEQHLANAHARYLLKNGNKGQTRLVAGFILGGQPLDHKTVERSLQSLDDSIK